jgi:hypothetical protein
MDILGEAGDRGGRAGDGIGEIVGKRWEEVEGQA